MASESITRRMTALTGVLSRYSGMEGGLEFSRNFAQTVLSAESNAEVVEASTLLREMLELRRENWPSRWEGRLTDAEISLLAAEGAQAWERASRTARAA